jgi:hypothetical protein
VERGEHTPVHVEAGQLAQQVLVGGVDRAVTTQPVDLVHPLGVDQDRPGPVAARERPAQHELTFGDEQPVRRLEPRPQLDIGECPVIGEPFVVRVSDDLDHVGDSRLRRPRRESRR